jgi:hypothetical protein
MGGSGLRTIINIKNIKYGFKTTWIWPLNPKAMDNKIRPLKVYIVVNLKNARSEKNYTTNEEVENNPQWGKEFATAKFLYITKKNWHPTFENLLFYNPKNDQRYYVNMPKV